MITLPPLAAAWPVTLTPNTDPNPSSDTDPDPDFEQVPQFAAALSVAFDKMHIALTEAELDLLVQHYKKTMPHGAVHVQWRKFAADVEAVFTRVGLEKNPHETPSSRVLQHAPHTLQPPGREAAVQARISPCISPISPIYLPEREAAVQARTPTPTPTPKSHPAPTPKSHPTHIPSARHLPYISPTSPGRRSSRRCASGCW